MKATIELPDELMRELKVKAAREDRKLKELIPELIRRGLRQEAEAPRVRRRVMVPLINTKRKDVDNAMTPERVAEILLEQEVEWHSR